MKRIYLILLSILTGIMLSAGWPSKGFPLLLLFAFVPLLFAEDQIIKSNYKKRFLFLCAYISFLTWNSLTTWWIINSTVAGMLLALSINSLFMALIFLLFHVTKKNAGNLAGYISLVTYWIGFEYLHLNWEFTWSWLNLGNGFANYPHLIQWYEFTGVLGGSLWILTINILLTIYIINRKSRDSSVTQKSTNDVKRFKLSPDILLFITIIILFVPYILSTHIYKNYREKDNKISVCVVQPNIDPYNEKFGGLSPNNQIIKMLGLADKCVNKNTDLLVFPETAISEDVNENKINSQIDIISLKNYIKKYPDLKILIGMSSYKDFAHGEKKSETARKYTDADEWYDCFNAALFLDSSSHYSIYHKSKLVPGVERIPYPAFFKPLEKYAINLGGTTGSLGTQNDRTPFRSDKLFQSSKLWKSSQQSTEHRAQNTDMIVAPAICYESIFGEFISKYVKNGANLICIITNDGWWGDTPGYKQHLQYARLRAVETRRSIARSANTGISCFINQRGDILNSTNWWKEDCIQNNLNLNNKITFYVKYGDYIGKICAFLSLILVIFAIIKIKKLKVKS